MLDIAMVRECLNYDESSGVFTWKERPASHFSSEVHARKMNTRLSGKRAGRPHCTGYRVIGLFGKAYLEHRIVWLFVTGFWPDGEIDHINHKKDDNRICNLRLVSHADNSRNRAMFSNNTSGNIGVSFSKKTRHWSAHIGFNGKRIYLGCSKSKEEVMEKRMLAEIQYRFHENHGA